MPKSSHLRLRDTLISAHRDCLSRFPSHAFRNFHFRFGSLLVHEMADLIDHGVLAKFFPDSDADFRVSLPGVRAASTICRSALDRMFTGSQGRLS